MKKIIFIIIFFQISINIIAQKKVYFSNKVIDSIKVQTLNGFRLELSQNPLTTFNIRTMNIPVSIGYFNERRIAPSWTLISSAEIGCNFFKESELVNSDSVYTSYGSYLALKNSYSIGLKLGVEPRWYFNYKSRFQRGLTSLNSGWYISLPITCGTTFISNSSYFNKPTSFYDTYYATLFLAPSFGYRQAFNKHFFLEGSFKYLNGNIGFYEKNKSLVVTGSLFNLTPTISLKVAYTF